MRFCTVFSCVFIHFCRAFLYIAKMRFHYQLMRFHKTAHRPAQLVVYYDHSLLTTVLVQNDTCQVIIHSTAFGV